MLHLYKYAAQAFTKVLRICVTEALELILTVVNWLHILQRSHPADSYCYNSGTLECLENMVTPKREN